MKARRTALLAAMEVTQSTGPRRAGPIRHRAGTPHQHRARSCALPTGHSTATSGGPPQTALVYSPADARRATRLPVFLTPHRSSSQTAEQVVGSGIEQAADRHGFLAVAPQRAMPLTRGYQWNVTGDGGPDDEQYLIDVLGTLAATGSAGTGQVLASGYSNGSRMVSQYACDQPGHVTATTPVSGPWAGVPVTDDSGATVPDRVPATWSSPSRWSPSAAPPTP
ncbi:hypothetical protein [Streptomyces sp. Wh19]|uniref:hypothetical protein n=1 Tax=Streptomyces sp. Wh19 TaxID=3076629 RepID=UPI002958522A|nr:hypothetical protein [Streptomyces sp. Wh19]MDV9201466.1 hypothetical protein [Streptomyces sp. Wh19]